MNEKWLCTFTKRNNESSNLVIDPMAVSDMSKSTFWLRLSEPEHNPFAFQTRAATSAYEKKCTPTMRQLVKLDQLPEQFCVKLFARWMGGHVSCPCHPCRAAWTPCVPNSAGFRAGCQDSFRHQMSPGPCRSGGAQVWPWGRWETPEQLRTPGCDTRAERWTCFSSTSAAAFRSYQGETYWDAPHTLH